MQYMYSAITIVRRTEKTYESLHLITPCKSETSQISTVLDRGRPKINRVSTDSMHEVHRIHGVKRLDA